MADSEHLAKIEVGVPLWNGWRKQNPEVKPNLSGADLHEANLSGALLNEADLFAANLSEVDLHGADLSEAHLRAHLFRADLSGADLSRADLSGADLSGVGLSRANLYEANLSEAHLFGADLSGAYLSGADLSGADLTGAHLTRATLVNTNLEGANLTGCSVFGISAWNLRLKGAIQTNLLITPEGESPIQVDNLEVAQFIYPLLNNEKIRSVIDTITSKVVLILGRFTPDRKIVLDALRDGLRKRDYLPILFDFEKPTSRSLTDTISTLAHMARFVIADITDAKSVPQELMRIVPFLPTVPVQPLLLASRHEYGMFRDFRLYPWVLEPFLYNDQSALLAELDERVIAPAEAKARKQVRRQK